MRNDWKPRLKTAEAKNKAIGKANKGKPRKDYTGSRSKERCSSGKKINRSRSRFIKVDPEDDRVMIESGV